MIARRTKNKQLGLFAYFGERDRPFRVNVTACAACGVARLNSNAVGHVGSVFCSFSVVFGLICRRESPVRVKR